MAERHQSRLFGAALSGWRTGLAIATLAVWLGPAVAGPNASSVPDASQATGPCPIAVAVRATETDGVTSLVFDLDRPVAIDAFLLDKPDRLVVDMPRVDFELEAGSARLEQTGIGLIHSFRFGLFASGRSRIVVDLGGPATLRRASVEFIAGGDPSRLVIELARSDRSAFKAALRRGADVVASQAAPVPVEPPVGGAAKPTIVIDPGHGGVDPGASGADGVTEKSVVFDFASALADKLRASGRYTVFLTRTGDQFVSLADRVRVAQDSGANLMVSVHADTLSDPSVNGATVYTASDRASDAEAASVEASQNRADEVAGLEAAPDPSGVSDILFDLTRRETRTYAHLFQRNLIGYWQKIARLNKRPDRSAGFKVLQAPDVPSVLLELGYLSSDRDSKLLVSPDWRDKTTAAVASSIDAFFSQRRSTTLAASLPGAAVLSHKVVAAQPHP